MTRAFARRLRTGEPPLVSRSRGGYSTSVSRARNLLLRRWLAAAIALIATFALAMRAAPPSHAADAGERASAHASVIGGDDAQAGTFPWIARVLDLRGEQLGECSGTVIAPTLVLTAGHCAENFETGVLNEPAGYLVLTGTLNADARPSERQESAVSRVIVCSCYDRSTDVGDVALLQLSTATSAPPVALAATPPAGTPATIAGWGQTEAGHEPSTTVLQSAPTAVQRAATCENDAPPFSPPSEICALGTHARLSGICEGDSGGPLLVSQPSAIGGAAEIGLASHAYDECATSSPSVFTRVDALGAWIAGWVHAIASGSPGESVASPVLPGIATAGSGALHGHTLALTLRCDGEGGPCAGLIEASVVVRERMVRRSQGRRTVLRDGDAQSGARQRRVRDRAGSEHGAAFPTVCSEQHAARVAARWIARSHTQRPRLRAEGRDSAEDARSRARSEPTLEVRLGSHQLPLAEQPPLPRGEHERTTAPFSLSSV